jgi:hypothetical protein
MIGTVAKRIRREVCGDCYTKGTGYVLKSYDRLMELFNRKQRRNKPGTIVSAGLRREYRNAKSAYSS